MNTNYYVFLIISGGTLIFMSLMLLQLGIKFLNAKKELAEAEIKVIYEKKFVKVNYDNDMKVINELIENYSENTSFIDLKEYHDSKNIINDKVFQDLTKKITLEINNTLSTEYKELLGEYLADPQMYIYEKVYYKILTIIMDINKKNISNLPN